MSGSRELWLAFFIIYGACITACVAEALLAWWTGPREDME